jgi:hypothetical protein
MEDGLILGEDLPLPPARLFERLAQIPGYTWDQSVGHLHVRYDRLLTRQFSLCPSIQHMITGMSLALLQVLAISNIPDLGTSMASNMYPNRTPPMRQRRRQIPAPPQDQVQVEAPQNSTPDRACAITGVASAKIVRFLHQD